MIGLLSLAALVIWVGLLSLAALADARVGDKWWTWAAYRSPARNVASVRPVVAAPLAAEGTAEEESNMTSVRCPDYLLLLDLWRHGVGSDGIYRLMRLRAAVRRRGLLVTDGARTDRLRPQPVAEDAGVLAAS